MIFYLVNVVILLAQLSTVCREDPPKERKKIYNNKNKPNINKTYNKNKIKNPKNQEGKTHIES